MEETAAGSWLACRLVAGHGIASGQAAASPYPAGSISLQAPLFRAAGLDLSPYFPGTLNLVASGGEWRLQQPDVRLEQLRWTDRHPPETFSFWHCRLRQPANPGASWPGLIYHPHPETKVRHFQPPDQLEVLAPWIAGLHTGAPLELAVDGRRVRLIQTQRLRARLLEFLKFRVLAAQATFFADLEAESDAAAAASAAQDGSSGAIGRLRQWLGRCWPEALDLSDADLRDTLDQARQLYLD